MWHVHTPWTEIRSHHFLWSSGPLWLAQIPHEPHALSQTHSAPLYWDINYTTICFSIFWFHKAQKRRPLWNIYMNVYILTVTYSLCVDNDLILKTSWILVCACVLPATKEAMRVSICVSSYGDISSSSSPGEKENTQALANNSDIISSVGYIRLTARGNWNLNQTSCAFFQICCKKVHCNEARILSDKMNGSKE